MFNHEMDEFTALLDDMFALSPTWKPLTGRGKALFFAALQPYPLELVSQAMTAHIRDPQRGKFQPVPADLIAQMEASRGGSGRPGADEAWSIAMLAEDESETVVWTEEMRDAFAICKPVLEAGDKIGARMAFKDAYTRIVSEANRKGRPAKWETSLGHDPHKRTAVIEHAVQHGLLPAPQARAVLPAPAKASEVDREGMAKVRAALANMVSAAEKAQRAREAAAQAERDAVAARKRELAEQARVV